MPFSGDMVGDTMYLYHQKLCKEKGWGWFAELGVLLGFGFKYAKEADRDLNAVMAYLHG